MLGDLNPPSPFFPVFRIFFSQSLSTTTLHHNLSLLLDIFLLVGLFHIFLIGSSSFLLTTCPIHNNLDSLIFSVIHETPALLCISSFLNSSLSHAGDCGHPDQTNHHIVNEHHLRTFDEGFKAIHLTGSAVTLLSNLDLNL